MAAVALTVGFVPWLSGTGSRQLQGNRVDVFAKSSDLKKAERITEIKGATKGFVKTWFIDSYHQYKAWPEVHRILTVRNLKSVEWQEAYDLAQSGEAILVDVREAQDFKKIHAQGSFSAPLFRLIQGNDFKANLRRLGYALLTEFAGTGEYEQRTEPILTGQGVQQISPKRAIKRKAFTLRSKLPIRGDDLSEFLT